VADAKEWYRIPGVGDGYPNEEAADEAARAYAADSGRTAEIIRCTETVIRRYTRQVTVVPEDVTALDA
jgi:hypothetical protein